MLPSQTNNPSYNKVTIETADPFAYESAIVFGFPMMLLATFCPKDDTSTYLTLAFCALFFIAMNIILFRNLIFRKKKAMTAEEFINQKGNEPVDRSEVGKDGEKLQEYRDG